jgi:hypothetical protein
MKSTSFKKFITESFVTEENGVAVNKRAGIEHFHAMKPVAFVDWIDSVKKDAKGKLKDIKTVLKVDGLSFRFGKSKDGKIFIEGARTGPQFDVGAFRAYAAAKNSIPEILTRAAQYDDLLKFFKTDRSIMPFLPNNVKCYCELFYNPMAKEDESGIAFVTVKYDKSKLGSLMTILPYSILNAETGTPHENEKEILKTLYKKSNSTVKVIDPSLQMGTIDISAFIDPLESLLNNKEETKTILQSRKKEDKEAKQNLLMIVQKAKDQLADHLLFNPEICGLNKLCKTEDGEGIVLHLPHGTYKVTSKKFQADHAAQKR